MRGDSGHPDPLHRISCDGPMLEPAPNVLKRCGSCKYWLKESCHREAPAITENSCLAAWPFVSRYDWCGEWDGGPR